MQVLQLSLNDENDGSDRDNWSVIYLFIYFGAVENDRWE